MNVSAWWKNRSQPADAQQLLQNEVDLNLQLLKEFWKQVKPRKGPEESHRVDKIRYASELAQTDLPSFSRESYARQEASLSQMVSGEQRARLAEFYNSLSRLEAIQQELREKRNRDIAAHTPPDESLSPAFEEFNNAAPWLWMEAARLIEEALEQGNPLGKKP